MKIMALIGLIMAPLSLQAGPSAARDRKGDAAHAAVTAERPTPPQSALVKLPPGAINSTIERLSNSPTDAGYMGSLSFLIRNGWEQFDDVQQAQTIGLFSRLDTMKQRAILDNIQNPNAIKTLSAYISTAGKSDKKPSEVERKKGNFSQGSIDAELKRLSSLRKTDVNQMEIYTSLTPLVNENFKKFTATQKKQALDLYLALPQEYHEDMRRVWYNTSYDMGNYFETEHQKALAARRAEGSV